MTTTTARAVALLTFLSLSGIGVYTVLYHLPASTGDREIARQCPDPPIYAGPPQLHYTGLHTLDVTLCDLVAFFHACFERENMGLIVHFLSGIPPVSLAYLIESARPDSSRSVLPVAVGFGWVFLSGAAIMPLAWLALVLTSAGRPDRARKPLTRARAEAVFAGVLIGYVLPTAGLLLLQDEYVTAYWQAFPASVWLFQHTWLLARRGRSTSSTSGLPVVRAALVTVAMLSAAPHFYLLYHSSRSLADIVQWWPSLSVPDPRMTTLYTAVYHLLQWDSIIWYTCSVLAAAFMTESRAEGFAMLGLAPITSAVIGPGAVVALFWLRREEKLVQLEKSRSRRDRKRQ